MCPWATRTAKTALLAAGFAAAAGGLSGVALAATVWRRPYSALSSECADWAYDSPSEGSLPAAVGVEGEPGQFPVPVLGVVGQDPPRGIASISGRSAWQVHDEVGVLGHRSYCA